MSRSFKTDPARELRILDAMPGTSREIVHKTELPLRYVRAALRVLREEGSVRRRTRFLGQHAYTWVYERVFHPRRIQ